MQVDPPSGQEPTISDKFSFSEMKPKIDRVIESWREACSEAVNNRNARYADMDVDKLRDSGDIQEDETFVPDRVIDGNIMREKPDQLTFLNQSNRLAIFKCKSNPKKDSRSLEKEFTAGLTYKGWYREFERTIDGAILHGNDSIEVVYDSTKPLHVGFEHIGHDKLFYNRKVGNIQDSEFLIREYEVTTIKLEQFSSAGFNQVETNKILEKAKEDTKVDKIEKIYKIYFKDAGIVYVAWYSKIANVSDWLKAPTKLRIGLQVKVEVASESTGIGVINTNGGLQLKTSQGGIAPSPNFQWIDQDLDMYPIFSYLYRDDEQEQFTAHVGRAFLDMPHQEASTCILTSFVNRLMRSANIYASPSGDSDDSSDIKQLDVQLVNGAIFNKPLQFFSIDPPDVSVLTAMQFLGSLNAQAAGKTNYAVSNRKDARKTAKELDQSEQKENKISYVAIAGLSEFLREVFDFAWKIVQSQALQGKIKFLLIASEKVISLPGGISVSQVEWINDIESIQLQYDIRPAGDVDVIEKNQKQQQMQQDWPVIQTTALATKFLSDYIRLRYPDNADEYAQILEEGDKGKALVASLSTLLKAFASKEDIASLSPEELGQLQNIQKEVEMYLGIDESKQKQEETKPI